VPLTAPVCRTFSMTVSEVSRSAVLRVTSLCAQKSLLCGSTEPSDHSGPSCSSVVVGSRDAAGTEGFASGLLCGEALGPDGLLPPPALGVGRGETGGRLVAPGDSTGGEETATVGCAGVLLFTTDATA